VPVFSNALGISSYVALGITFVASAAYLPLSTLRGNLQGLQKFRPLSLNRVGEKAVLIFAGGALVLAGFGVNGAILGLIASVVAMIVYAVISMGHYGRPTFSGVRPARLIKPSAVVLATALGVAALANIDSLIAKSVFPDDEAGVFNAIGRLGKILFFIALAFNRALFPKSVRLQAEGRSSTGMLLRSLGVMAAASLLIVPMTVPVAHPLISLSLGHNYAGSSGLVPWYFGAMGLMAMVSMLMYYNVAIGNRAHLWPLGVGLCVLGGLFILEPNSPFQLIAAMILTYLVVFAITFYVTLRAGKQRQLTA
jgi:O-antigen/teichoic acid export membrane protein